MTVAIRPSSPSSERFVTLEKVSWDLYDQLIHERDAANEHYRITYDRGRMVIMSPLPIHERVKRFLGQLVEIATWELGMARASYGSTTWKDRPLNFGIEADECYYIGREPDFDPNEYPDLNVVPAPDLSIEVDITHHPIDRLALYAKLGVAEVWRYDGKEVEVHCLNQRRTYDAQPRSKVLPVFAAADLTHFVAMFVASGEMAALRTFREWLKHLRSND